MQVALRGAHLIRRLSQTPALRGLIKEAIPPDLNAMDDAAMIDDFRARASTCYHPVGTCMMGAGPDQSVVDTNLKAVFRMSRAVIRPMMKQRYGRIVNITSVVGASGNPGQANYAAAKAGVAGMTRALARELGSRNITVNCVAPGFIATDMTHELPEAQKAALLQQIPLQRLGQPASTIPASPAPP